MRLTYRSFHPKATEYTSFSSTHKEFSKIGNMLGQKTGWMHETSARTWCSGRTWRERVEREVGGGIGMGKTCKLKDVSFQCMTKFTTNKKKKKNCI